MHTLETNEDPDEIQHDAPFDQGICSLLNQNQLSE